MRADSTKRGRAAASGAFRASAGLLLAAALAGPALAQTDPYKTRVRGLTEVPYPSYQGDRCTTIDAPRATVWRVLTSPDRAYDWLMTDLDVIPLSSRLKKGTELAKGEVLVLSVDTKEGQRAVELTVLAAVENQLLAIAVTKDDDVISPGAASLIYTFVLEEPEKGRTDLYWATHYDSDSPLAAAVSPLKFGKKRYVERAEHGLLVLRGKAEGAALLDGTLAAIAAAPAVRPAPPTPRPTPAKKKKRK